MRRYPAAEGLRRQCPGSRRGRGAAPWRGACFLSPFCPCACGSPPVTWPDQSPQRPGAPTPAGQGVGVLVSTATNQNFWPRGSCGTSPLASEARACSSQRHRAGDDWRSDGDAMHKAPFWPPASALAGADWQSSAPHHPPHLPMAMHSCRIWPKGRRRLNWSCPSKERESYQGKEAQEGRREEGAGGSRPFPVPASSRRGGRPPTGVTQPAATRRHATWPCPVTHLGNCRRGPQFPRCQSDPHWTRNSSLQSKR